jgi:hypothetical protein
MKDKLTLKRSASCRCEPSLASYAAIIRCHKSIDKGAGISSYFLSGWNDLAYQIVAYSFNNRCKSLILSHWSSRSAYRRVIIPALRASSLVVQKSLERLTGQGFREN